MIPESVILNQQVTAGPPPADQIDIRNRTDATDIVGDHIGVTKDTPSQIFRTGIRADYLQPVRPDKRCGIEQSADILRGIECEQDRIVTLLAVKFEVAVERGNLVGIGRTFHLGYDPEIGGKRFIFERVWLVLPVDCQPFFPGRGIKSEGGIMLQTALIGKHRLCFPEHRLILRDARRPGSNQRNIHLFSSRTLGPGIRSLCGHGIGGHCLSGRSPGVRSLRGRGPNPGCFDRSGQVGFGKTVYRRGHRQNGHSCYGRSNHGRCRDFGQLDLRNGNLGCFDCGGDYIVNTVFRFLRLIRHFGYDQRSTPDCGRGDSRADCFGDFSHCQVSFLL